MNKTQSSTGSLHDWRSADPPPEFEARTLAGMHAAMQARRRAEQRARWLGRLGWRSWAGLATTAACVGFCALLLQAPAPNPVTRATQYSTSSFVPVVPPERWARYLKDGEGTAWVVRTELPSDRLALLGLPYDPSRADQPVSAELLMHASGDVLAVRLID